MKQENRELLLKDLCARLPYGVIIQIKDWTVLDAELKIGHINRLQINDVELKPYLFPLSSMTDKELTEFLQIKGMNLNSDELKTFRRGETAILSTLPSYSRHIDWLNAHHFDYRGLIEKGLAIPVAKENNPYK